MTRTDDDITNKLNSSLSQPQVNNDGGIRHFLGVEGLSRKQLHTIIDTAEGFFDASGQLINRPDLDGCTVMNLFFENSTRTRTTFEVAEKRLGANVLNIDIARSSTKKGESLRDTLGICSDDGGYFCGTSFGIGCGTFYGDRSHACIAIINGGDSWHAHPTQAMLDMLTIHREANKPFEELSVAIIGDIKHSQVARSDISALKTLGVPDIRVIAPRTLLPKGIERYGVKVFEKIEDGVVGCDVLIGLRIQNERIGSPLMASSSEYFKTYGITPERVALAKPDALVMHPVR